jgi:hypothetical protein
MTYLPLAAYLIKELTEHPSDAPRRTSSPAVRGARPAGEAVVIRRARPSDSTALTRLAALDSRPVPEGELLLAEAAHELRAALSLEDRTYIADPFHRTSDIVALLADRAIALSSQRAPQRALTRLALWSGLWSRAAHVHPSQ